MAPGNTIGFVPLWSGSKSPTNQIASSNLFQSGSNVGLGTTSPAALFDVNGTGGFRDSLTLFPKGSDPTLSVQGTAFGISSTGLVSFVSGQTFPGTGNGTITGVTAGTDLTGGGSSGNVTLNLDTTRVPQLGTANTFTANQTINGNLSATFLGAQIAGFTGSSSSSILLVQQKESGFNAIAGLASGAGSVGVEGEGDTGVSGSGTTTGVSASGTKQGMEAEGLGAGSIGVTALGQAFGVVAQTLATSGNTQGVEALATSPNGIGTLSTAIGESKTGRSLIFCCPVGVWGDTAATAPGAAGLVGTADNAQAIVALNNTTSTSLFTANIQNLENTTHKVPVMNVSGAFGHCTADTDGDLACTGTISKGGGSFKIDHPLDPANKYLYHSFVESPDMMNIYNGVVTLGEGGAASVQLPDYFEALNRDFRYQLTSLGRSQPDLYIAREVSSNSFEIAGGQPGGRVSWQVTGIRHDAYAEAHRIQTEVEKAPEERGKYLHPDLFGAPLEELIGRSAPPPVASAVSTGPTRAEMTK